MLIEDYMGYHNNEDTTKKAIKDCQKFINDRTRLEYALEYILNNFCNEEQTNKIITDIKKAKFNSLRTLIRDI